MVSLPLNRVIARFWVPVFISLGLSANGVTLLSLASGLAGGVLLGRGGYLDVLLGAVFFLLANVLDECDGQVARQTGTSSGFGSWLDTVSDCIIHVSFFLGLGSGLAHQLGQSFWWVLGQTASVGVLLSYLFYIGNQVRLRGKAAWLHPDPPKEQCPPALPMESLSLSRTKEWLRIDFSWFVIISALFGKMAWLVVGGALGAFLFWIPTELIAAAKRR